MGEASLERNIEVGFGSFESVPPCGDVQEALDSELAGVSGMEGHMWAVVSVWGCLMPGTGWGGWGVQNGQSAWTELWGSPRGLGNKEEPAKENNEEGLAR